MKNLFTLLLLVVSFLAVGQTNNTSEEIKYWKSIADSNDTVAYRQYLNRYGENGLYKDEAITRITLLKTSGQQIQSNTVECCFYSRYIGPKNVEYVVRFDDNHSKVWFRHIDYDTVRSNLAVSRDFYENQTTIALSRGTKEYKNAIRNDKKAIDEAEYAQKYEKNRRKKSEIFQKAEQAKSPDYYENAWTADEKYEYDPMKSTSARDVYFKRDKLYEVHFHKNSGYITHEMTYAYDDDDILLSKDYARDLIEHLQYRDIYCINGVCYEKIKTMQGYRYIAISKDKSSIIMWFEEEENLDGQIFEKRTYYRVPKEDLLPKAVDYDFLNE